MRAGTREIVTLLVVMVFILVGGVAMAANASTMKRTCVIEEDEPGWNCAEMGNRICGPVR